MVLPLNSNFFFFFYVCNVSGAHHIDLRAATTEDPDWLLEQRETEIKLIEGWLDNYRKKMKATFSV